MIVTRITTPEEVVRNWAIFKEGLKVIRGYAGESTDEDTYLKMLIELAAQSETAWVGCVFQGGPLGYGVAAESTPPFAARRTFTVISFYHVPGQFEATKALMSAFESWAMEHNVGSYIVTTRRNSGPAIRCFSSEQYGFKRAFRAFEKHLNYHASNT